MKEERIIVLFDSDVLKARRIAREMSLALGFDNVARSELEISVSELTTNLLKHSTSNGEMIIKPLEQDGKTGIEIIADDKGPGINDLQSAMKGGNSTAGTLGIGLHGVKRLMDDFDIESRIGKGTHVCARKWTNRNFSPKMKFSVLAKPKPGENVSGDAYFIKQTQEYAFFCLIDVLGHGDEAYEDALLALELLSHNYTEPLAEIIQTCHRELKHTRGIAIAICKVIFHSKKLEHISIGNIETRIFGSPEMIRPFCYDGTVGISMETLKVCEYPYYEGCTIIMFTDGISDKFDVSRLLLERNPQEIASYIFDNYSRNDDDATVLVGR